MTRASLKTTWLYTAPKVEVRKQGVVTLFLRKRVSISEAVCWETRKHGFEVEFGKVTSCSTITQGVVNHWGDTERLHSL
ncbi:hypothetical protein [Limnospira platensis]|uniref:hypothetical protein n=1 Tax=Limnospira platensis TaxID=118562 RepID=UPI001872A6EB|nr:hypothetical protein [Arthrospira platensis NCB002]